MAENSAIGWTHHTQNYWVGCEDISPACKFCYARDWAKRAGRAHLWEGERERTKDWSGPRKWNKSAAERGVRERVFSNSLSDFFDNQADPAWRRDAWVEIKSTPHLDHLILTKRPQNIPKMTPEDWGNGYPNVWLGTTVENQTEANRRIPELLAIPARIHFLSVEPMLGPVDLGTAYRDARVVDWVICGGESGPKRRTMEMEWVHALERECRHHGTTFFFKQDTAARPGQRGRAGDQLWASKQFPEARV